MSAVTHVLVVATTVEIALVGVVSGAGHAGSEGGRGGGTAPDGGAASSNPLALQPLPQYALPSDGVAMTAVAGGPGGRIFLGGGDGRLYELTYAGDGGGGAGDGGGASSAAAGLLPPWRAPRRVSKRDLSGGLASLLPSFAASLLSRRRPAPALQVAVDAERGVLYLLTGTGGNGGGSGGSGSGSSPAPSTIAAFDLGPDGRDPAPRRFALLDDVPGAAAARAVGGRDVFPGRTSSYYSYGGGGGGFPRFDCVFEC